MNKTEISHDEIARRGEAIYAQLHGDFTPAQEGKILAIDVDSGDYEMDDTTLPAADRLRARHPDALVYVMRVGYESVYTFGGFAPHRAKQ